MRIVVIGGGIVGLAVAYRLSKLPGVEGLDILEKEGQLAHHQTGHNSGVLHSGIYYKPGSLKAINCRQGKAMMERFCAEESIDYDICGKVIVATEAAEIPRLKILFERGQQNGVRCQEIGPEALAELEPHSAGIAAIHVPEAGIVNYRQVCERLAQRAVEAGARLHLKTRVKRIHIEADGARILTDQGEFQADRVINCAGLYSDRLAQGVVGASAEGRDALKAFQIVPFRGEYFQLVDSAKSLCRNLIYPVPDPQFPFLGVHFTRMIDGSVECGPNAVLAFAREGYRKSDIHLGELWEALTYPGFQRMAARHWKMGMGELWRSFSKNAFVTALQKLMPDIRAEHLIPAPAGVRAQALGRDGALLDDFKIIHQGPLYHVCNAPSPAATSSLSIADHIIKKVAIPH